MKKLRVMSLELKVKGLLRKLFTVYGLHKLSLRGVPKAFGTTWQSLKARLLRLRLAMTFKHNECVCINKSGFTLIEIIMIIVVVSIAIPTLLIMVGQEAKFGVDAEIRVTAANVAQQLLEEIKAKCFDETSVSGTTCIQTAAGSATLGPEAGEGALSAYDDVDDFNDLTPADAGATCTDTVTVNSVTFTRAVQVCYVNPGVLNTCVDTSGANCTRTIASGSQTDYKLITVTVTPPATAGSSSVALTTLVTNY